MSTDQKGEDGRGPATITDAAESDAEEIAAVLVASITELCEADHRGDADAIASWTANKTPQIVKGWIEDPELRLLVSREGGEVVCVGATTASTVRLNYVAPKHRFRGHSKAMLGVMETVMAMCGTTEGALWSSETAHQFYRSHGWADAAPPDDAVNECGRYMTKTL